MNWLYAANVLVLLIVVWAVWERRVSFGSRWDAPFTWGLAIFGLGIALDSPWPEVAATSYPITGKYYLLNTFGHIAFLAAEAPFIKGLYMRLMPEADCQRFVRWRVVPLIGFAAVVMLTCVLASPATSVMTARHLYLVPPDGWLIAYWVVYCSTLVAVEGISVYGIFQFRRDPDIVGADAQIVFTLVGPATTALIVLGVLMSNIDAPLMVIWPASYISVGGCAIAAVWMWRHRIAQLTRPPEPGRPGSDGRP